MEKKCPMCGKEKKPKNKTCGAKECIKKCVKIVWEDRWKKMRETFPRLKVWEKDANQHTCVVCGEDMRCCLDKHHNVDENGKKTGKTVYLCGSCHRIYDTTKLKETTKKLLVLLKRRREKLRESK